MSATTPLLRSLLPLLFLAACGGGDGSEDPQDRADGSVDSEDGAAPPDDDINQACEILAPKIADCAGQTFSVSQCEKIYSQGEERGCDGAHIAAFVAFTKGGGEFVCDDPVGIGQDDLYPNTNDEKVVLGAFCPITVQNTSCHGISCGTGSDCPGFPAQGDCNGRTEACFEEDSFCPALPCNTGSDCPGFPSTADCNGAINTCFAT